MKLSFKVSNKKEIKSCVEIISNEHAWQVYGFDYHKSFEVLSTMEDILIVAKSDDVVVGFITIKPSGVGNIGSYIRMVAVHKDYRNIGVGEQLVKYIQDKAFEFGMKNIFLICSTDNIRAIRFYERVGFKQVGILDSLIVQKHDEVLFRRVR